MNSSCLRLNFAFLSLMLLAGCQRGIKTNANYFENNFFIIENTPGCTESPLQGIDSFVGRITCGNVVLDYEYGIHNNKGPLSAKSLFEVAFYNYYYSQFFNKVHVDPKLSRAFRDSVSVKQVLEINDVDHDKLVKPCGSCNAVAELEFKNKLFLFPFTVDQQAFEDRKKYTITEMYIDSLYYKTYFGKGKFHSGLFISPDPFGSGIANELSVTVLLGDNAEADPILKKIRLKK